MALSMTFIFSSDGGASCAAGSSVTVSNSPRVIISSAKWAEEQQKDGFCQAAWALCRKKNKLAAELARVEHYVTDRNVLFREGRSLNPGRTERFRKQTAPPDQFLSGSSGSTRSGLRIMRGF